MIPTLPVLNRYHVGTQLLAPRSLTLGSSPATGKPLGIWYGFGDEWIRFCLSKPNGYKEKILDRKLYEVEVRKPPNLLVIRSTIDVDYLYSHYPHPETNMVNWREVQRDYDGVEFPIYSSAESHLTLSQQHWYTKIDLRSGCLWRLSIFDLVEVQPWSLPEYSKQILDLTSTAPMSKDQTATRERSI